VVLCDKNLKTGINMETEREKHKPRILMATVYLKSKTGKSLITEGKTIPVDPKPYLPAQETGKKAMTELQQRGFVIEAHGITLSISGRPELFEKVCGVKISFDEIVVHELGKTRTQHIFRSSQPVMHIQGLDDIIEGITLTVPGIPFERA
jgi:hypothetical protein